MKRLAKVSHSFLLGLLMVCSIGVAGALLAHFRVADERNIDFEDIDRRAHALAYQLSFTANEILEDGAGINDARLAQRLDGYGRLIGSALYRADGHLLGSGAAVGRYLSILEGFIARVIGTRTELAETVHLSGMPVRILALPLLTAEGDRLRGVLAVLHDISYIEERTQQRMVDFILWTSILTVVLVACVILTTWFIYERPLRRLAAWMRKLRTENAMEAVPSGLPIALLRSETGRLAISFRAARAANRARSRTAPQADNLWTREKLRAHAVDQLEDGYHIVVASNREPYMHQMDGGKPRMIVPAGGLVTALDPVLQACGGLWVAHGAGDADRMTADARGRIRVPPEEPRYTLRRVWLSREEEQGYYYGFSNEGLWPLCHLAYERPIFRASDWRYYALANQRFAQAVLDEIGSERAVVLVQDYQLALVPQLLKDARPDLCVGIFWHIPWPNPEAFRICPWRVELLQGMLGADLVGFHLQQYCNNFLDTVDRMLETRLDWDHFAADLKGHTSIIRPYPISVQAWSERRVPTGEALARQTSELQALYALEEVEIAVSVDRIDYTKGIPERFRAIERFFEKYPGHRNRVTFVALGAPSRTHLRRYREHIALLETMADDINWKYQTDGWRPIRLLIAHHDGKTVHAFLSMSNICIVSSLQDGMNLVAKEYVAAQASCDGVLVLSELAGAARELTDALIVNPYDTEQVADAIHAAMVMDAAERRGRMERMRKTVEENNIYRWAATFLADLGATRKPDDGARSSQDASTHGMRIVSH